MPIPAAPFTTQAIAVKSSVTMRSRRGVRKQPQRRVLGRAGGRDPVNRVLLATAVILNEWRSMHPARRPGAARSWLVPSWPSGLLLSCHGGRLAAELAGDHILRAHVRARLGVAALSRADVDALDAQVRGMDLREGSGDGKGAAESAEAQQVDVNVTRALIAGALVDPADKTAAMG